MLKFYLLFILFFVISSCDDDVSQEIVENSVKFEEINLDSTQLQTDKIYEDLKTIPAKYLQNTVKNYLNNIETVIAAKFNSSTLTLSQNNDIVADSVKIQPIELPNLSIIGFSGIIKDKKGYRSYFYFIKKGDTCSNITHSLVDSYLLDIISEKLNAKITYQKFSGIYAYLSGYSSTAIMLDFSDNFKIDILEKGTWQQHINIIFNENNIIVPINRSKTEKKDTILLSSSQLEGCKKYTNLKNAIIESNKVYIVDLSSMGLEKINDNLLKLSKLQVLVLDDNLLKNISNDIVELKNLQIIRANNNELTKLPSTLGALQHIEELSVSFNKIEFLPISISKASTLKVLNLDNNNLKSIVMDWSSLYNLVILNLSNNQIKQLPVTIGKIKNLISLDISNNPIESLPKQIYDLKYLTYIDVTNTKIPDNQIVRLMGINEDITVVMD